MNEKLDQTAPVVLIVDSDPLTLTGIAAILHMNGYECHCAANSPTALKAARGLSLDLIVCDLEIDGDDGLSLFEELSEAQGGPIPVIFIFDRHSPDIARRVHDAGAMFYLRKPYDPHVLIELVDKALWMPHLVQSHMHAAHHAPAPSFPARTGQISSEA